MNAATAVRYPHSMAQNCACGARFRFGADTLDEVLEAFRQWWAEHEKCGDTA